MSTYYPQSALEGFTNAIASALGITIKLGDGIASTDGETVFLPRIKKPLDANEFTVMCGTCVHETAHVYYGSCKFQEDYSEGDTLRRACMNAVLDVADETRMERRLPGVVDLLHTANVKADADNAASNAFNDADPVWSCLAAGILWTRIGKANSLTHDAVCEHGHQNIDKMNAAYKLLRRCRATRRDDGQAIRPQVESDRLIFFADELVNLLAKLGDASGAPCNKPAKPGDKPGMGQPGPAGMAVAGMGEGKTEPGAGDKIAGEAEGEAVAAGDKPGEESTGDDAECKDVSHMLGGSIHVPEGERCRMNVDLYATLRPVLMGAVERMARHDFADGAEDGYLSGTTIGRGIERAMIDGHCFSRRQAEGENMHAVVLLDNSGSMEYSLPAVSAIAQAFADSLAAAAKSVDLATFECDPQPRKHFRNVGSMGGTGTAKALRWARETVESKGGKRVVVVITDGCPDDRFATANECGTLVSHGVHVIGIAYKFEEKNIRESMPGAQIIAASDPSSLALQLTRIAAQIAAK